MKKWTATVFALVLLAPGAGLAQTLDQPPVEACKPGSFTIIGFPEEIGPKRDRQFNVLIDEKFEGQFLTTEGIWMPSIERSIATWNGISGATWKFNNIGTTEKAPSEVDGLLTIAACGFEFECPDGVPVPPDAPDDPMLPDNIIPFFGRTAVHQTALAVTLVSADFSRAQAILDADIFLNPAIPFQVEPGGGQVDFESVLVHELGHSLGLGHNDNCVTGPTVMESLIELGELRRGLSSSETEGVKFLYPDDSSPAVRIFDNDRRLRFDAVVGALPPLPKDITIYGVRSDRWAASVTTSAGGNWLVLDPPSGNFTSLTDIEIGVDSTQLPEGSYTARITFSVEGHPGPAATVDVDLQVSKSISPSELPTFVPEAIVNGANLLSQSMAPGGLFTIFGSNLATVTATADQFPLPTNLGGTEVIVNGFRAPLLYVSPGQLNAQVPAEIFEGRGGVIVRTGLGQTLTIPATLQDAAPELFLINGIHAVVLNQDNKVNTSTRPAAGGSKISIFFSGQGPVDPPVPSGQPAPVKPLARVTLPAQVEIAGQTSEILYIGLTPGFAGLAQADVRVPQGVRGELAVRVTIGGSTSNVGFVSVQ